MDNRPTDDECRDRVREICKNYMADPSKVFSGINYRGRVAAARRAAVVEMLKPPYNLTKAEIAEMFGFISRNWTTSWKNKYHIDVNEREFSAFDSSAGQVRWSRTPREIINSFGPIPQKNRTAPVLKKKKLLIMTLLNECPGIGFSEVGRLVGLDHTTIMHHANNLGRKRFAAQRERDENLVNKMEGQRHICI